MLDLTKKYALRRDPFTEVVGLMDCGYGPYPIRQESDMWTWAADGKWFRHVTEPHPGDLVPLQARPAAEADGIEWGDWTFGAPPTSASTIDLAVDRNGNVIAHCIGKPRVAKWRQADGMIEKAAADGLEAALIGLRAFWVLDPSVDKAIREALAAYRSRL